MVWIDDARRRWRDRGQLVVALAVACGLVPAALMADRLGDPAPRPVSPGTEGEVVTAAGRGRPSVGPAAPVPEPTSWPCTGSPMRARMRSRQCARRCPARPSPGRRRGGAAWLRARAMRGSCGHAWEIAGGSGRRRACSPWRRSRAWRRRRRPSTWCAGTGPPTRWPSRRRWLGQPPTPHPPAAGEAPAERGEPARVAMAGAFAPRAGPGRAERPALRSGERGGAHAVHGVTSDDIDGIRGGGGRGHVERPGSSDLWRHRFP